MEYLIGILIGAAVAAVVAWLYVRLVLAPRLQHDYDLRMATEAARLRKAGADQSRVVLKGKISEHLAPFLPGFLYEASDTRFLGSPIDLVVFDGYGQVQAKEADELRRVVFVEVKTGGSDLTAPERRVRDCVQQGRVEWELLRLPDVEADASEER